MTEKEEKKEEKDWSWRILDVGCGVLYENAVVPHHNLRNGFSCITMALDGASGLLEFCKLFTLCASWPQVNWWRIKQQDQTM